jgi:putative ABC transport system permease protein
LVQLVLVQSAMMAALAAALGSLFAWWAAPMVVHLISVDDSPVRLTLPMDWRVAGFALGMMVCVMLLFGLGPALRAARVEPASVMKGGDNPLARRRRGYGMIAGQVAFCFLVVFIGGLMVRTFQKLTTLPTGFSSERLLNLETVTQQTQPPIQWQQAADRLSASPGVEQVALASWPLLAGQAANNFISVNGAPTNNVLAFFLQVSPGWLATMKIPLLEGRDFSPQDTSPGQAIVSEAFAKTYFNGEDPVGKSFDVRGKTPRHYQVVGVARDAAYRSLREPTLPIAYLPFSALDATGAPRPVSAATFVVRTAGAIPMAMAATLRQQVARIGAGLRVSTILSQQQLVQAQTVRERLLAILAVFFAGLALLLSGVGLFGMVHDSVLQRQREIGIRMAIGARRGAIARLLATSVTAMVATGALAGAALGLGTARYIEALFFEVKASDAMMLAIPCAAIALVAATAALPGILRAMRIDPAEILRSE